MAYLAAKHCLVPQPKKYSQVKPGMDPHDSSGNPNLAFYLAAMAIGGTTWEKAGLIWYQALTGFPPSPSLKMAAFAKRTRQLAATLFSSEPAVAQAIVSAWRTVGVYRRNKPNGQRNEPATRSLERNSHASVDAGRAFTQRIPYLKWFRWRQGSLPRKRKDVA